MNAVSNVIQHVHAVVDAHVPHCIGVGKTKNWADMYDESQHVGRQKRHVTPTRMHVVLVMKSALLFNVLGIRTKDCTGSMHSFVYMPVHSINCIDIHV